MKWIALLVVIAGCNRAAERQNERDRVAITELVVERYVAEWYPQWSLRHPEKACPASLKEIAAELEAPEPVDAWKHELIMYCGKDLPAGARSFAVRSVGPDGKPDTDDDIKSW